MKEKNVKKKKIRIRYNRIIIFLIIILLIAFFIFYITNLKIKKIEIKNNDNIILNEQDIIKIANLSNDSKTFQNLSMKIKSNLENNSYILSAKVTKKNLTDVYIEINENYPLLFNSINNKTVLFDGTEVSEQFNNIPSIVNYVPETKYAELVKKFQKINKEIITRISQIEYSPNDYDDERFLLFMNDGNYTFINLYKFELLNKYLEVIENFGNKRGILYLDSGNYFEIKEN